MLDTMTQDIGDTETDRTKAFAKTVALDAVRLMPGDALQLQPLPEEQFEPHTVRAIGLVKPLSVLVTAPAVGGKLVQVREGQPFVLRTFSGLSVCSFRAVVLETKRTPYPYLHLSYPDSVTVMRIRKSVRAKVRIPVQLHDKDDGRQLAGGRIVDLSAGGAHIVSSEAFGEKWGTVVLAFKIKLDDIAESLDIPAVIHYQGRETAEDGRPVWATAVNFKNLGQQQRLLIMNLVYQHLLKEHD